MEKVESFTDRKNHSNQNFCITKTNISIYSFRKPDENKMKTLKTNMFTFLWNEKPDRIKRDQIIQEYENGGLKMIDIDSFVDGLKSTWIKRFIHQPESKITKLYSIFLENYGNYFMLKNRIKPDDTNKLNIRSLF